MKRSPRSFQKPEVINNQSEFQKLAKAHAEMTTIIETYRRYKKLDEELAEASELLKEGLEPNFPRHGRRRAKEP